MYLSNEGLLVILFVGLVAGWLAGKIVRGTGFGILGDIVVGILGALVASLLFPKLAASSNPSVKEFDLSRKGGHPPNGLLGIVNGPIWAARPRHLR